MKSLVFIILPIILAGFSMTLAQEQKEFKLYLLPPDIKSEQLAKIDIHQIKPSEQPFLTTNDIWSYLKETHEITLYYTATNRLKNLKVSDDGTPFIVFVGDEPIYTGAFWNGFNSMSFRGIAVDVGNLQGDFPKIKLGLDYPPLAPKNLGFDPRPDPRVFEVFRKAHKLSEQVWMWGKCRRIEASGKRRQSFYFTFEITKIVKSNFDSPEINFELFDTEGFKLINELNGERLENNQPGWRFDREKEILLKFERKISTKYPNIFLRTFEVK